MQTAITDFDPSPLREAAVRQNSAQFGVAPLDQEISTANMQGTLTRVSSRLKASSNARGATAKHNTTVVPNVSLEAVGRPNVNRVVQSFHPLLERLLERVRQSCTAIPFVPPPSLDAIY